MSDIRAMGELDSVIVLGLGIMDIALAIEWCGVVRG